MKPVIIIVVLLFASLLFSCKEKESDQKTDTIPPARKSVLDWTSTEIRLGDVRKDSLYTVAFHFTNTSDSVAYFTEVETSCECTTVTYVGNHLKPHTGDSLVATFNTEKLEGYVERKIYAVSYPKGVFHSLKIIANVIE